jgi:hypothetical protein
MIIGICGLIGSGKDTIADHLVKDHKFVKISFADKLKDTVATLFEWDRDLLDGKTEQSRLWREQEDHFWSKELKKKVTPRYVLQVFGTECMRDGFYDGIWVSMLKKKVTENPDINWVIPDVRFENEVKVLKEIGGEVWWVKRGQLPMWFRMYQDIGQKPKDVHPSEWQWANAKFDKVFENDSTINALKSQVQDHLVSNGFLQGAVLFGS